MSNNLNNIAYSILDLVLISQGDDAQQAIKNSLSLAQNAEKLGYTRFWLAEHHNAISIASSATSVLIGHIAGGTEKIRVGSGGIMLPNHSPLIVAEQFGTLAHLYPNRIDLCLGRAPGTDQLTAHAIRSDRMQSVYRFPDEVKAIQQYFSPHNQQAKVRAPIAEGMKVPIYILGSSTDSAHLAAKMGLPYAFASHFAATHLMEALAIYRNEFQPSAFLKTPYCMAGVNVIAAETDAAAERMFTTLIKAIIGILTNKRSYLQPPSEMTAELLEVTKHPAVRQMLHYSFVGSKATVKAQTEDFLAKTEVDELIVTTNVYDIQERIHSYRLFSEIMQEKVPVASFIG